MLGVADSERLLPLLAELLPGLGELAHCKLGHGEALQGRSVRGKPEEGGKAHIVCGKACQIETAGIVDHNKVTYRIEAVWSL